MRNSPISLVVLVVLALLVGCAQAKRGGVASYQRLSLFAREGEGDRYVLDETDDVDLTEDQLDKISGLATATPASFLELGAMTWPSASGATLTQLRADFAAEAFRRKSDTFAPCTASNHASATCTGAFTYTVDGTKKDRVTKVEGKAKVGPGSNIWGTRTFSLKDLVFEMNARSNFKLPTDLSLDENLRISCGHVVASSIGGSNNAPINFFPHRKSSNSDGLYHYMEELVGHVLSIGGECGDDKIDITIVFAYTNADDLVPNGGTYHAKFSEECVTLILAEKDALGKKSRNLLERQRFNYFKKLKASMDSAKIVKGPIDHGGAWVN